MSVHTPKRVSQHLAFAVPAALLIAACGAPPGGDAPPRQIPGAGAAADAGGTVDDPDNNDGFDPLANWPAPWLTEEDEMLVLVNEVRASGTTCPSGPRPPVGSVATAEALVRAARSHALDMATQNYFDHDSLDGRDPFDRMREEGFDGQPRAENIAAGNSSAADTLAQWLSSDGHCINIMTADVTHLGVGYAADEDAAYTHYWVQAFGRR